MAASIAPTPSPSRSVYDMAFGEFWNIVELAKSVTRHYHANGTRRRSGGPNDHALSFDDLRSWLMYAVEHPGRGKGKDTRKPTMNAKQRTELVQKWVPIIRGLSTAHDKATVDRCEFDMETHLMPMLSAKVADLRAFYTELVTTLKADETIPLFVWKMFESWGDVVLKHASDTAVRELKTVLATEIVELIEEDVRPDIGKAIAGALQWRGEQTLTAIRDAVKGGAKPRLVGKESCLFLQVDLPSGQTETVML